MSESQQPQPLPESTTTTRPPRPRRQGPSFVFPLLLILVGVVLLLNTMGILPWYVWWRLWILWPAIFILIGIDILLRRTPLLLRLAVALVLVALLAGAAVLLAWHVQPPEALRPIHAAWPLEGISRGEVTLNLGAGEATVEVLGDSSNWAEVDLSGTTRQPVYRQAGDVAYLEVTEQDIFRIWPQQRPEDTAWRIRLNPAVPTNLDVNIGLGQCTLDLGRLSITGLNVNGGVGQLNLTLPGGGTSGTVKVRVHGGLGSINISVPEGTAVQIHATPGLGGVNVLESRFPRSGDVYRSAGYDSATYRLDVELSVGVGSIEVH